MRSRSFQLFVVIFCGLILAAGLAFSFLIHDSTTQTMLIVFGILYVLYLSLFLSKEKERRAQSKKNGKQFPLKR